MVLQEALSFMSFKHFFYKQIFIGCYLFAFPAFSQQTIILNTALETPISNQAQTGFADQVLAEAFQRMGYKLKTVQLPAERALINANNGLDDGDLLRIGGLQKSYPNLIQVPEKVMDMDLVLFTKNKPLFQVKGWESIMSSSVAIMTGWKIYEMNLARNKALVHTENAQQLFSMLQKNRVDFAGYSRWSGLDYIQKRRLSEITLLEPPLVKKAFYTYLHKKHEALVPKLAQKIREMKEDGTIKSLFNSILKPLMLTTE